MSEALTADDLTRDDEITLDEAVDFITDIDSARNSTRSEVWAVIHVDTEEFDEALSTAVSQPGVVVHKAVRTDGAISIALQKFADEL